MRQGILNSRATTPVAIALIVLGVASLIVAGTTSVVQFYHFLNSGHHITVPNETLTLAVEPDTRYSIQQRVSGTHVTENRPALTLPDTFDCAIHDALTGQPVAVEPFSRSFSSSFFGLTQRRLVLRKFRTPPSGEITFRVGGLERETVFYVGPRMDIFTESHLPLYLAWAIASLLLIVAASGLIAYRILKTTPDLVIREDDEA